MKYIRWFDEISIKDIALVGGKNASLGEMFCHLEKKGVCIPNGFAITAEAYWYFLKKNDLVEPLKKAVSKLTDISDLKLLKKVGHDARKIILSGSMPTDLADEIIQAYHELSKQYKLKNIDVAVRSSATAEDLPTASFAGQQETFLNITGEKQLFEAVIEGMASLFTDRAIVYRVEQKFNHFDVGISIGVQKMVRSDLASAGVAFTLDPESGFADVICINSSYGLGENIVKGVVTPDEFFVYKPKLTEGFKPILKKRLGDKKKKLVYTKSFRSPVKNVPISHADQLKFSLSNEEILEISRMCIIIEDYYSFVKGGWNPQDIEWAKDGLDNQIYIVQSRPETVHASRAKEGHKQFVHRLKNVTESALKEKVVATGFSIGQQIVSGPARIIKSANQIDQVHEGDIVVTEMTDPDWVPIMKRAAAIVTDRGGRTCHAAIVSRELGLPALVGAMDATKKIKNSQLITLDASRGKKGYIYDGELEIESLEVEIKKKDWPVQLMINLADPDRAFTNGLLPVDGVGLARLEFIIANTIKVHPMALIDPKRIKDKKIKKEIAEITAAYATPRDFFIEVLAQEVGTIVAAFYDRPVIVRLSDFKSNEYRNLIGGGYFEPVEENPMLGLRGASRYTSEWYAAAFEMECATMRRIRETMGLSNMKIMIPFVRTVDEAQRVIEVMKKNKLVPGKDGLELVMMVEVPSNCILIDQFCKLFDGFSIGSNDLTQLTLGVDRDSQLLASLFDERDEAVKEMMKIAIEGARRNNRFIGICGQAPSDYPEITQYLIKVGITSVSLNVDALL